MWPVLIDIQELSHPALAVKPLPPPHIFIKNILCSKLCARRFFELKISYVTVNILSTGRKFMILICSRSREAIFYISPTCYYGTKRFSGVKTHFFAIFSKLNSRSVDWNIFTNGRLLSLFEDRNTPYVGVIYLSFYFLNKMWLCKTSFRLPRIPLTLGGYIERGLSILFTYITWKVR